MADPNEFKLFRTVDPSTVNVPLKDKFAKLTLSSNKKKQQSEKKDQEQKKPQSASKNISHNVSRQLLSELNEAEKIAVVKSYEHPLLRSDSSSSICAMEKEHTPKSLRDENNELDFSDYMEVLQLSSDGCTQRTVDDFDVEVLSTQVSNLTVQPPPPQQQVSICISSTTEEDLDDDENSCITISDTSGSECNQLVQRQQEPEPVTSMAVSSQVDTAAITAAVTEQEEVRLSNGKVQRIEAFLRDVSFERREMKRRGHTDKSADHTRLASADTESMSLTDVECSRLSSLLNSPMPTPTSLTKGQRFSNNRLANNDTEINTECSADEQLEADSSKRLAHDDTEVNTPDLEEPPLSESTHLDETIPESSIEVELSPARPTSASSVETVSETHIQVSSINISAKINIKIHIPQMDSSSGESDDAPADEEPEPDPEKEQVSFVEPLSKEMEPDEQEPVHERSVLGGDASEDEQFLTQAEKLLNQLYGKSWQTPDIIRTLKRSSGSGGKSATKPTSSTAINRTPFTEIKPRQPRTRRPAATTAKKRLPAPPPTFGTPNESALGDFSIFKQALHSKELNSTHLPKGSRTERRPVKQVMRINQIPEDRWRALIDTDSGTDASDDDDANATGSSDTNDDNNDGGAADGNITYLDLTKAEVEVVSNPDDEVATPMFPKRLDDILRTCRATDKPKLPASPATPENRAPTRRQLFTPNTGYENDNEARRIVEQALELDNLEQVENVYMPGTTVHKRLREVQEQLGIAVKTPKGKPIFKLPTPRSEEPKPPKKPQNIPSTGRKNAKVKDMDKNMGKCSFMKSLEPQIGRDRCDNEAFFYRENFAKNKEQLASRLYDMFNAEVFNNELQVPITWSKLLRNTAGRCKNKKRLQERSSVVELSVKVLTSADRLRCTLVHELCHAAAWVFNGEGGHGVVWKRWAQRANDKFPDLPPIRVCHNYDIEFKYTYKCVTCNTASHAHSRSRKVETLRCRNCRGPITLLLNKKDKFGNIVPTPVREATGFAKFVKDNFQKHKRANLTAAEVMRILSAEYAKEKGKGQLAKAKTDEASEIVDQVETLTLDDNDNDY